MNKRYNYKLLLLLFCFTVFSFAQKNEEKIHERFQADYTYTRSTFVKQFIGEASIAAITEFIQKNSSGASNKHVSWKCVHQNQSKTGNHFLFQQYIDNVSVYNSYVKVNTSNKGYVISYFDNTFIVNENSVIAKHITANEAQQPVFYIYYNMLVPAWYQHIQRGMVNYERILDEAGNVLYQKDLNVYYQLPTDSLVTADVFLPDPLTTAGVAYGIPYKDNSDADVTELNAERTQVNMRVKYVNDTFKLESPYVLIKEFSSPVVTPVYTVANPNFSYTRSQSGFEDVNVFYHIDAFQRYVQQLGFTNLGNYQIHIDTHGMGGQDNSVFNPSPTPPTIAFGEGGVDDAEDADVVIHEYGHALSASGSPSTNSGVERQCLDEANSDYLASSYSRSINAYGWDDVFSWDGHNEFWSGRKSTSTKHYPEDKIGHVYDDTDIWSSTLMQIWEDIGREATDELVFELMYNLAPNMTFTDAAQIILQSDSLLNNGTNYGQICSRFEARGLVGSCPTAIAKQGGTDFFQLLNTADFANGGKAILKLDTERSFELNVYSVEGKLISSKQYNNVKQVEIDAVQLVPGFYMLKVKANGIDHSLKLIRN